MEYLRECHTQTCLLTFQILMLFILLIGISLICTLASELWSAQNAAKHWYLGFEGMLNRTSLKRPPPKVVLNEWWSLMRVKCTYFVKMMPAKMRQFMCCCCVSPALFKGVPLFVDWYTYHPAKVKTKPSPFVTQSLLFKILTRDTQSISHPHR